MKLAILLLLASASVAAAVPPRLILVEIDQDQLDSSTWSPLVDVDAEPGGVVVPANADASWFRVGLKPGDVIRYRGGDPVAASLSLSRGLNVLELERAGKPIMLRVLIHGPAKLAAELDGSDFRMLLERLADPEPRVTPVHRNKKPSGVRVTDYLLGLHVAADVGDIIRSIRGVAITSNAAFVAALQQLPVGASEMLVERFGRPVTVEITRKAPIDLSTIKRVSAVRFELPRATFDALEGDVRLFEHHVETVPVIKDGLVTGVRLFNVRPDATCVALGLREDDILLDLEGRSVGSFDSIYAAKNHISNASQITLRIERGGKRFEITYTVRK